MNGYTLAVSFAEKYLKKKKMLACNGIKNICFFAAEQLDGAFGPISGVNQLCQGLLFC